VSKVVEKVVSRQLNEHLTDQGLLPRHQSAYRKYWDNHATSHVGCVNNARRWLVRWICRRPSTVSTIPCCCNDWSARSACLGRFCAG